LAIRQTKVVVQGGILGPLGLNEVKRLRQLVSNIDVSQEDEVQVGIDEKLIDRTVQWLDSVIEEELTVPRIT
jgi:hypothetical protein